MCKSYMKTTWSSACILSYPGRMTGLWLVSKWQTLKEVSLSNLKCHPEILRGESGGKLPVTAG